MENFQVWLRETLDALLETMRTSYPFLEEGRHRAVFLLDCKRVLKVPTGEMGIQDNLSEARIYSKFRGYKNWDPRDPKYASCGIVSHVKGVDSNILADIPCLEMELVETGIPREDLPDWADWIDCGQVGLSIDGEFVAYDYA